MIREHGSAGVKGRPLKDTEWRDQAAALVESSDLTTRIPGVSERNPWSQESLKDVESEFIRRFGDVGAVDVPESVRRDYQQFLGEGMVRTFGGEWVTLEGEYLGDADFGTGYCVRYDGMEHLDVTNSMLEMSLATRTGSYWAALFETNAMLLAG